VEQGAQKCPPKREAPALHSRRSLATEPRKARGKNRNDTAKGTSLRDKKNHRPNAANGGIKKIESKKRSKKDSHTKDSEKKKNNSVGMNQTISPAGFISRKGGSVISRLGEDDLLN